MDKRLRNAAESGDTNLLYSLIKQDPYILKRLHKIPYVDTPLHAASRVGHVKFVREIIRLKPSFAKKPNQDGLYPIHLAAIEGQFEVLRALLRSDIGLARLQGREGQTCLHFAAAKGDLLLLDTLLLACPQSMLDVTDASETALHIALKHSNLDAFYFLLRTLRTACHQGSAEEEGRILNFKDVEGNTLLHIAVWMNLPQLVKQLVRIGAELNQENAEGLTAMDLAEAQGESAEVIKKMLRKAGALNASAVPKTSDYHVLTSILPLWSEATIYMTRYKKDMNTEARSLLLIVSVLIATVTFQAAVAPPKNKNDDNNISLALNITANSSTSNINALHCSLNNTSTNSTSTPDPLFWTSNIVGLSSSTLIVILLLPGKYLFSLMYLPLYCFIYCYAVTAGISGSWSWLYITLVLWTLLSYMLSHVYSVSKKIKTRKKRLSLVLLQEDFL